MCRLEERRGCLGHAATLRFLSPLIGRVGDRRFGLGRSLCSLLTRSFVCERHNISTKPRFQPPVGRKKPVMQQPGKSGVVRRAQVPRRSFDMLAEGEASRGRMELLGPASGVVANDCNR